MLPLASTAPTTPSSQSMPYLGRVEVEVEVAEVEVEVAEAADTNEGAGAGVAAEGTCTRRPASLA